MFYFKKFSIVFALICLFFLSSCLLGNRYKAIESRSPYVIQPQEALVVVGKFGALPIKWINQYKPLSTYRIDMTFKNIYVIPVPVGNSFKIDEIMDFSNRYAKLKNTRNLEIIERGIYYYGNITIDNRTVKLSYDVRPEVKKTLQYSYSKQVGQPGMKPINFSW